MLHVDLASHPDAVPVVESGAWPDAGSAGGTAVIICTRGRPDIVTALVGRLAEQTQPPEHVFVIASSNDDIAGLDRNQANLTVRIGRTGLTLQRNDGLALAGARFSNIVFFDDDFVPSRYWLERMAEIFAARPDIAGMTGTVLEDGTTTEGVRLDDAEALVGQRDIQPASSQALRERFAYGSNVGCNMAYRYAATRGIVFDEHLPLYAWHEDSDFRAQVERRGLFVRAESLWGVHLGHKPGRVSGVRLGYSQIANVVYLARKGTIPRRFLLKSATKNLLANALRSLRPETFVDRRGRLRGNLTALADLLRGRIAPERILEL
ncbi:glycosyltransferase [soil metagenome]